MLKSSTHLQNRSFHVVERTRTSTKGQKRKNERAKRAKILFFIVKYANLWRSCFRRRRGCLSSLFRRESCRNKAFTSLRVASMYHFESGSTFAFNASLSYNLLYYIYASVNFSCAFRIFTIQFPRLSYFRVNIPLLLKSLAKSVSEQTRMFPLQLQLTTMTSNSRTPRCFNNWSHVPHKEILRNTVNRFLIFNDAQLIAKL